MLRSISRHLKYNACLSNSRLQRIRGGLSSTCLLSSEGQKQEYHRNYQHNETSYHLWNRATLFAAVILGTAIYNWRNFRVSDCFYPRPIIYVDWSVPTKKSKRRVSLLSSDDHGDSKSVDKSGLSGVELEEVSLSSTKIESGNVQAEEIPTSETSKTKSAEEGTQATSKHGDDLDDLLNVIDDKLIGIPQDVPYIIIGTGTAAMAAARSIRGSDATARILMIGDEPHSPYMRPPLSKELWRRTRERQDTMLSGDGNMKRHSWMFFESDNFFVPIEKLNASQFGGIAIWKEKRVVKLNVEERYVEVDSGERIRFEKCLLATGGRPRTLTVFDAASKEDTNVAERIMYFRNIADFKKLREVANAGGRIVIVGGGFLGSELAVSLAELANKQTPRKLEVFQVFRDAEGNMSHVLPPYLAEHTMKFMTDKGVKIIKSDEVTGATWDSENNQVVVSFQKNEKIAADYVVVSVGLQANTQLADDAGLEVDSSRGGFLVNAELEARGGVYAAGDACSYYDLLLGRRRVEHINHAEESGRIAGRNMAGEHVPYHHQSSFWSTLGRDISWDAIGLIDSNLETEAFFAMQEGDEGKIDCSKPGVVFYLKGGKLVGVLLWNLPDDIYHDSKRFAPSRLNLVRKVLDDRRSYSFDDLAKLARDFDLHEIVSDEYEELREYMEKKEAEKKAEGTEKESSPVSEAS